MSEKKIETILDELFIEDSENACVILGSRDGLLSGIRPGVDNYSASATGSLAAMAAIILGSGEHLSTTELKATEPNIVIVKKDILTEVVLKRNRSSVVIIGAGSDKFLAVIVKRSEPGEELLDKIRDAARKIQYAKYQGSSYSGL